MNPQTIFILTPAIGVMGGADKASKLLAEKYADSGFIVHVFATSCQIKSTHPNISIHPPILNKGHKWKLPQRSLVTKMAYYCRRYKPCYIYTVGLTFEVRLALQYLNKYKIRVWETTQANEGNKFVDQQAIKLLHKANAVIVPSATIKANVINNYGYSGVIIKLPFWVEWIPDEGMPQRISRNNKILYIGRIDLDKGFDILFDALRKIDFPLSIDICGRGDEATIKKMATDLHEVTIHGFTPDEKLNKLREQADFIILPSKHEGYPLTLIEAMGYYKPVIASDVGSIPEVFEGCMGAVIFPNHNANVLAILLKKLYQESNEAYKQRMIESRAKYNTLMQEIKLPL